MNERSQMLKPCIVGGIIVPNNDKYCFVIDKHMIPTVFLYSLKMLVQTLCLRPFLLDRHIPNK